ncbi:MAG: type II secretion system F family protein [Phycisphaerales bacterium]|nr:type II secretion system F family protein [Phycisphaerales bacterium]
MTTATESTWTWSARNAEGDAVSGATVAVTMEDVASRLRGDGLYITSIDSGALPVLDPQAVEHVRRGLRAKRVSRADVAGFCQQLSVMVETGVSLPEGLQALAAQTRRREFREIIEAINDDVCGGATFSESLARWPDAFPTIMVNLVRAAELSGTMAVMLGRIADYLSKEQRTLRQVRGAMTYPAFMMGTGFLVVVFLVTFILPKFARIYEMRSASLPTPTKFLMAIGEYASTGWATWVPVLLAMVLFIFIAPRTTAGRTCIDWMKLRLPILRTIHVNLYVTRSTRTMSTLLGAGVNLMDVIRICRGVTRNRVFENVWVEMEQFVRDGHRIGMAFEASPDIPAGVTSMVVAGERSGRLPEVMEKVADASEEELDVAIKRYTTLLEPLLIACMGLLVGAVAIALLLPIFKMSSIVH